MKHLVLLWQNEATLAAPGTPAFDAQQQAYGAFFGDAAAAGVIQGGDPLRASTEATTVRVRDGATDASAGPFSSGPEQLIGYYVLDVADADAAAEWAARIPAAAAGAIEVRPILAM